MMSSSIRQQAEAVAATAGAEGAAVEAVVEATAAVGEAVARSRNSLRRRLTPPERLGLPQCRHGVDGTTRSA